MAGKPTVLRARWARRAIGALSACLPGIVLFSAGNAQCGDGTTLTLGPGDTLRGLAETHLHDPDAWPEILRANGIDSPDRLRPGMQIRIPTEEVLGLERVQRELRGLIYRATAAGAQVFATAAISESLARQAAANDAQRRGALAEALAAAQQGIAVAQQALEVSSSNRDVPAEAVLDEAGGRVQRRRPSEPDWSDIAVKALLAEQERLRTLSRSSAVLRFRDASSLRVSENANLAIRRIRRDLLTERERVDVVLYGGDIRALIDPDAARQELKVEVPGIETGVRSNDYWVQKSGQDTKLANYDGEIAVSAGGDSVLVRCNQGTLVKPNRPPMAPVDLLPAPALELPANGRTLYGIAVRLSWSGDGDAAAYWLEVAHDRDFTRLLLSRTGIAETEHDLSIAEEGIYYWRVSAIDGSGLPGPASDSRHFRVSWDKTPPYLALERPVEGPLWREPRIAVVGRVEPGATLTLNGAPVAVAADGSFVTEQALVPGDTTLRLEARDPAGNTSRLERLVRHAPETELPLLLAEGLPRDDQGRLIVNRPRFTLDGVTLAQSQVRVSRPETAEPVASGTADDRGYFSLDLPARARVSHFVLEATGPMNRQRRQSIEVVLDDRAPKLRLDAPLPSRTAVAALVLRGQVEGGRTLSSGDRPVALAPDGTFALEIVLSPGPNRVTLAARDLAGNESVWEQTVTLDREPPRLVDVRLVEEDAAAGRTLRLEIGARDESGLTAGFPYRVRVGDAVFQGIAQRCPDRLCHRDRIALPATARGRPRLSSVTVEDYLGNRQEIALD